MTEKHQQAEEAKKIEEVLDNLIRFLFPLTGAQHNIERKLREQLESLTYGQACNAYKIWNRVVMKDPDWTTDKWGALKIGPRIIDSEKCRVSNRNATISEGVVFDSQVASWEDTRRYWTMVAMRTTIHSALETGDRLLRAAISEAESFMDPEIRAMLLPVTT